MPKDLFCCYTPIEDPKFVMNPETKRNVKVGGKLYNRLVQEEKILPVLNIENPQNFEHCDHECSAIDIGSCCICSDQRPYIQYQKKRIIKLDTYTDGKGINRKYQYNWEKYCPECKERERIVENVRFIVTDFGGNGHIMQTYL